MVAVEEETPTSKRGFGKKVEFTPSTKVVREIRAIGGFPLEEEEYEGDNAFNLELYSKGVEEYERKLEELKQDQPKILLHIKDLVKRLQQIYHSSIK